MTQADFLLKPPSPNGKKFRSKPQLVRFLGESLDLTTFDYKTGKINAVLLRKNRKKLAHPDSSGGRLRNDLSLVSPVRQTASIFKQPVTVVKSQECKVRQDLKHGRQEKPRQVNGKSSHSNMLFYFLLTRFPPCSCFGKNAWRT